MNKDLIFETYLIINPKYFLISVIQKNHTELIYVDKKDFNNFSKEINFTLLDEFLKKNVFKIEKKINNFLNNIFLILDYDDFFSVKISIKKNYSGNLITSESLSHLLNETKKDCNKTILGKKIIHIIIENYRIDEKDYSVLPEKTNCDYLSLDINFLSLSNEYIKNLEDILKKYHILISKILSASYVRSIFPQNETDLIKMAKFVKEGNNPNEVILVEKKQENQGFFEKFFHIFR